MLELLWQAMPQIPLGRGVASANTGNLLLDTMPLLTMLPCAQTLQLYWRRRRFTDFAVFLVGFLLAIIYHFLHMHPEGIASAQFLGLSGPAWRGLDILCAQALLARTMGHAVGARSTIVSTLSNIVYPASLLAYAHLLAGGVLTLGVASKALLLVVLATLAAKAALEGFHTLPQYCPRLGKRTLACFVGGFVAFPMPELFPKHYWLFHSLWHLLLAEGYHLLYQQLEGEHLREDSKAAAVAAAGADDRSSGADGPGGEVASSGTQQQEGQGHGQRGQEQGGGWVHSLLQPWERLVRYQRQQPLDAQQWWWRRQQASSKKAQ